MSQSSLSISQGDDVYHPVLPLHRKFIKKIFKGLAKNKLHKVYISCRLLNDYKLRRFYVEEVNGEETTQMF